MNIVNICMGAPFTEGYSYQDPMLSDYQQRLGHNVTVITGLETRNESGKKITTNEGYFTLSNGVHLIRLAPKGLGKIAHNAFGFFPQIPKMLNDIQPDLIMVHGLGSHAASYAVNYKTKHGNTHLIADNHQDDSNTNTHSLLHNIIARYFRFRWKKWISSYDKVYGVTSWRTQFAHEQYGIPNEKLDVLVLGIDDKYINLSEDENNRIFIRQKYGIDQNAFLLCSGGKLDQAKAIISMMKAFTQVKDKTMRYIIFGSVGTDISEEFSQLLEQDDRFVYIGFIPSSETNNVLAASDFGMFAGSHSVLWEQAIGCGLPCLFRKYSETDHVSIGCNCVQIASSNVEKIKEIIEKVSKREDVYSVMKSAVHEAAPIFSYTEIAKKSLECMYQ